MGGLFNPLGTGVSPDGSPYTPAPPNIPAAPPAPTGPTKENAQKSNDSKDADRKQDFDVRLKSFMATKWMDLRTAYTVFHQIVWQNFLFYVSMLWIQWDQNRRIWQPAVPEDEWTPQPIVNNFSPAADAVASIFVIPEVEAIAPPGRMDDDDTHDILEIANALADDLIKQNALIHDYKTKEAKGDVAGQLFVLAGNIFTSVHRKEVSRIQQPKIGLLPPPLPPALPPAAPSDLLMGQDLRQPVPPAPALDPMAPPPPPQWGPLTNPDGSPQTETIILYDAEVCIINPLHVLPRAGAKNIEESRYLFTAERMSLDEIKELWGYEASPDNQFVDSMESSWEIALNFYYTGYSSLTQATKESALVIRCFIEPGKIADIPEGCVAIMINESVIFTYSWSDFCMPGEWALTHFGYLKAPTTFFKRTSLFDVAHIQKETNRYETIIALHAMTQSSDSLIVDQNTKTSEITGRGDRIIYYRSIGPGSKEPHRLQHGSLDAGVYEQRQKLEDKIQNITGAVAVWRGQQAGSVTAAAGISQLRGQAEQMFSKPTANWQNGWTETIRKGVKLRQKLLTAPQIVAIVGKGKDIQIAKFKAADLDHAITWVASTHGLPRTRDEKRNDMLALFDRGLLDVNDPNVRIEINTLFGDTGLLTMFTLDATRARSENARMEKGNQVQVQVGIEDLPTHLAIHLERVKRLDFDQLEQPIQTILLQHTLETQMAIQAQMAEQQAAQAAPPAHPPASPAGAGGAPGGGPHSSGPAAPSRPPNQPQRPAPRAGSTPKPPAARPGRPGPTNQISVPTGPNNTGGVQ